MSAVANKLREARSLIERGWTQQVWAFGDCVCSLGALNKAFTGYADEIDLGEDASAAEIVLSKAIGEQIITDWNDAPERTQADVLAAFDRAIEIAESGQ